MNYVNLDYEDGIGVIEFFTEKSNSLPSSLLNKLADTIMAAGINNEINVIILKSGGEKAFCAGASFDELIEIENEKDGLEFFMGFANVINAMRKAPKLIIARVHGKAVGGGVGLAAASDYCFATKLASIKLSELSIGIGPFVVGPSIERKMGLSAFSQMSINSTAFYDAYWACQNGLYMNVLESERELDDAIAELASELSNHSPEAMKELKSVFWQGTDHWDSLLSDRANISGKLVLSDFTKSTLRNFKERS